jgi:invasion protein IalB
MVSMMRMKAFRRVAVILLAQMAGYAVLAQPAAAQQFQSTHGNWSVFTYNEGGKRTCYIASAPTAKTGNYNQRGEPYLLVTHRSANADEISLSSGYPYKEKSEVAVTIDGKAFKLFTKQNLAWAYDVKQDSDMVASMKRGNRLQVRGTSQRGTFSDDTYSLSGFTAAYNKMKALCK